METFSTLLALCEGNQRSPVDSPHKGQWRRAVFSLICAWTKGSANNRDAGYLRCHCAHYDITVMWSSCLILSQYKSLKRTKCTVQSHFKVAYWNPMWKTVCHYWRLHRNWGFTEEWRHPISPPHKALVVCIWETNGSGKVGRDYDQQLGFSVGNPRT